MHQRIHAADMMLECPLVAISGRSNHLRATSALPPTGDIRWLMSAFVPITTALPPKADVTAVGCESPKMTRSQTFQTSDNT